MLSFIIGIIGAIILTMLIGISAIIIGELGSQRESFTYLYFISKILLAISLFILIYLINFRLSLLF